MYARIWVGAQFIIYIAKFSCQIKDGNAADKSDSVPSSQDSESQAGSESEDGNISKPISNFWQLHMILLHYMRNSE